MTRDIYKLDNIPSDYYSTDIFNRLKAVVDFIKKAINLIGKHEDLHTTTLRRRGDSKHKDFYDHIADLMFEIILSAASVKAPADTCWGIHYVAVWGEFFSLIRGEKVWNIIHFKLRRMLYDEILSLGKFPNYKSSKVLGFCLNVMGLKIGEKKGIDKNYYALHKVVLAWTKNNFLRLKKIQPDVAKSCLIGSISFDEKKARLVKTYSKGLSLEAPKEYLKLA